MVSSFRFYWHDCHPERSRRLMKIVLHRDTRRFFWSGLCWERCMEAFHFFWFQVSDFRMLNFEFFGTQIGGIGLILKISFTRLSPWAESKANENSFTQRYTEIFLKWIVLREMHGGVSLFLVSSFRFSNVEFWIFWNTDWRNWINFKN